MIPASIPPNEDARLRSLHALNVLDTSPDPTLDALVRTAARVLDCPIALVSLVDSHRQWFKSSVGLDVRATSRDTAFCAHTILGHEPMVVADTAHDPRFADNPLVVGAPHIGFYAGVPLFVDAHALGTLCVIDHRPKALSSDQLAALKDLARGAEHWLESRRAYLRLLDSERQFRLMAEQTPAIVYRAALDKDSSTLYVSPRVHELGYSPAEWMARPGAWVDILHPQDRDRVLCELATALGEGDRVRLHYRLRDAQGRWRHIEDLAHRTLLPGSDAPVLQGMMIDVTEKVEARLANAQRAELRDAQERQVRRLSAAMRQASEAILVTDLSGHIEYVNDAACRSSGYAESELLGRHTRILKSGNTPLQTYADLWAALTAGERWRGFLFNRRRDGSEYVEFATITPVRSVHGEVDGYLAVKEDVTEKRRMHDELERYRHHLDELVNARTTELDRARSAAESASSAKSAFLATMSHEIRTPLNGVIGMTEVLRQSPLSAEQQELASTINDSATALLRVLDDVLDFSKIEAGRLQLERQPFDLFKVVEGSCDTFQALAASQGVELRCFVDPALGQDFLGDAFRLRQILTNLIGNAIKFSAGLGRTGVVEVRAMGGSDACVAIEVRDNGIGMDEQVRGRLFEPFVQGESGTTRRYGGTGLGLVIVRRLAGAMAGTVQCESQPGKGSVFRVSIPDMANASVARADRPLLQDLHCHLLTSERLPMQDWAAYLEAAGATVRIWHQWPAPADPTHARADRTVWLADVNALAAGLPPGGGLVVLQPGQRRKPSRRPDGYVALDIRGVHRSALIDAVLMALQKEPPAAQADRPELAVRRSVDADSDLPGAGRVLVAEDNPINRKVIGHQLRLLGVDFDMADDGEMALQKWSMSPGRYGLVLTDLHMPAMDGFELTKAIRSTLAGSRHLPIVALTASAPHGETDRCAAAGMDACLSKPVSLDILRETLVRWMTVADHRSATVGSAASVAVAPTDFDPSVLHALLGDKSTKLAHLKTEYLCTLEQAEKELDDALAHDDLNAVARTGHRLKSSSRSMGATALADLFEMLDQAGRAGDASAVRSLAASIAAAAQRFRAILG